MEKSYKYLLFLVLFLGLSFPTLSYKVPGCINQYDPRSKCQIGPCNHIMGCSKGDRNLFYNHGRVDCFCEREYTEKEIDSAYSAECNRFIRQCKISSSYQKSCVIARQACSEEEIKRFCDSKNLPEYIIEYACNDPLPFPEDDM